MILPNFSVAVDFFLWILAAYLINSARVIRPHAQLNFFLFSKSPSTAETAIVTDTTSAAAEAYADARVTAPGMLWLRLWLCRLLLASRWLRFFVARSFFRRFLHSSRQHLDCSKCAEIRLSQYYFCLDSELFEVDPDYRVGASSGAGGFRLKLCEIRRCKSSVDSRDVVDLTFRLSGSR